MGQYHIVANLDKKEYIQPHSIGLGLKQAEQIGDFNATMGDIIYLLLSTSNDRGGGDVPSDGIEDILGMWAGDRVIVCGDYGEPEDIAHIKDVTPSENGLYADIQRSGEWKEISSQVIKLMESAWGLTATGNGWRKREVVDKSAYLYYEYE